MKFVSSGVTSDCFFNTKSILNLSAPEAFSFDVPVALSSNAPSSAEPTKLSVIERPTL